MIKNGKWGKRTQNRENSLPHFPFLIMYCHPMAIAQKSDYEFVVPIINQIFVLSPWGTGLKTLIRPVGRTTHTRQKGSESR